VVSELVGGANFRSGAKHLSCKMLTVEPESSKKKFGLLLAVVAKLITGNSEQGFDSLFEE
jgi:hypothetical protein